MNNVFERLLGAHVEPPSIEQKNQEFETLNLSDSDGAPFDPPKIVYPEYVPVRVQIDPPGGFEQVSMSRWYGSAAADATGVADVRMPAPGHSVAYQIMRIGSSCSTGSYAQMLVLEDDGTLNRIMDVSRVCPDIADEVSPIWVQDIGVRFRATGMVAGDTLNIMVQHVLLRRFNEVNIG